ncbi:MAG: RsmB/NOP family class I SAM-dependent RNA methyltransferase [bacterium]
MRWKRAFLNQQRYLEQLWFKYLTKAVRELKFYQFDLWLEKEFRLYKQFGKRDRQWYSECLYSGLRFARLALELWNRKENNKKFIIYQSSEDLAKALIAMNPDFFWKCIEQRCFLEEEVDLSLQKELLEFQKEKNVESLLLFQGLEPKWKVFLDKRVEASSWSSDQLNRFLCHQSLRAPLWIRIHKKEAVERVLEELKQVGAEVIEQDHLAFSISYQKKLNQLETFLSGKFELQDWASQQILSLLKVSPKARVWDACAGGGGKSVQVAAELESGELFLSDIREHKLKNTSERLKRMGFHRFHSFVWNGECTPQQGPFDVVIVDAPCSSSGVLRRNPELRFKIFASDLVELSQLQLKILHTAGESVKLNGDLLYGTCSVFAEENEEVIHSFLKNNPGFVLEKMKIHGSPEKDSDTTFSALLKKIAD